MVLPRSIYSILKKYVHVNKVFVIVYHIVSKSHVKWFIFSDIRLIYLFDSIASNGWCIYKCHGTEEDLQIMATVLVLITAISVIVHLSICICDDDTSCGSISLTCVVALLDMFAQVCLNIKILRSKRVDLTWFHAIKVGIQIYKTYAFIKEIKNVWYLYENQNFIPNPFVRLLFFLTIVACIVTMIICGKGAMIKLSG